MPSRVLSDTAAHCDQEMTRAMAGGRGGAALAESEPKPLSLGLFLILRRGDGGDKGGWLRKCREEEHGMELSRGGM